jgi:hypothetical protein
MSSNCFKSCYRITHDQTDTICIALKYISFLNHFDNKTTDESISHARVCTIYIFILETRKHVYNYYMRCNRIINKISLQIWTLSICINIISTTESNLFLKQLYLTFSDVNSLQTQMFCAKENKQHRCKGTAVTIFWETRHKVPYGNWGNTPHIQAQMTGPYESQDEEGR